MTLTAEATTPDIQDSELTAIEARKRECAREGDPVGLTDAILDKAVLRAERGDLSAAYGLATEAFLFVRSQKRNLRNGQVARKQEAQERAQAAVDRFRVAIEDRDQAGLAAVRAELADGALDLVQPGGRLVF